MPTIAWTTLVWQVVLTAEAEPAKYAATSAPSQAPACMYPGYWIHLEAYMHR